MNRIPLGIKKCYKCKSVLTATYYKHGMCCECLRIYQKERRIKNGGYRGQSAIEKLKNNARSMVRSYVRRGNIERHPCEECGSVKSEMHHSDYSKPLEVKWLCRFHHMQLHGAIRTIQQGASK